MQPLFGIITPVTAGIVLFVALMIFGPGKLPDLGKALGGGIKEFRSASDAKEEDGQIKE
ncbi:MAG: twin-arginine translocase TatA/TatE family subunit [Eubacteriales bacterium]